MICMPLACVLASQSEGTADLGRGSNSAETRRLRHAKAISRIGGAQLRSSLMSSILCNFFSSSLIIPRELALHCQRSVFQFTR